MIKPHPAPSHEHAERLATRVREVLDALVPKGSQDPSSYLKELSQELLFGVIGKASEFFAYCPDDFCIQSQHLGEAHMVFGGTNRLLWSVMNGFRPDPTYCTEKFKEQFAGSYFEPIAKLWMGSPALEITPANFDRAQAPEDTKGQLVIPISRAGVISILGRKSRKGDGKIAEVVFYTGVEA